MSTTGSRSSPDRERFYHFRNGGYESILYVAIGIDRPDQREFVRSALKDVQVPGKETREGFRVFDYAQDGQAAAYLRPRGAILVKSEPWSILASFTARSAR